MILHHFKDVRHPPIQGALDAAAFNALLDRYEGRILDPGTWVERSLDGTLPQDHICLTFDDALRSQIDVALPILSRRGIKAFFFVYSSVFEGKLEWLEVIRYFRNIAYPDVVDFYEDFYRQAAETEWGPKVAAARDSAEADVYLANYAFYSPEDRRFRYVRDKLLTFEFYTRIIERMMRMRDFDAGRIRHEIWMTDEDLLTLQAAGQTIGLHSYTHPTTMGALPKDEQFREYDLNRVHLTRLLGYCPEVMAHPSGSYNDDTLRILEDMKVRIGFRSDDRPGSGTLLEQPRLDHTMLV